MHVVDFFFQAEDGIRDWSVTGVQTCALPISDATYVEPLDVDILTKIVERERPDAVLPTLGGQTALNLAMALHERDVIGVPGTPEMIGANATAIATAEDREQFKAAMQEIGLSV